MRIECDHLLRVEGHGGLTVRIEDGRAEAFFDIFEGPRLFEGLLAGRLWREASDLTARICGLCPVAHQVAACKALESAMGADTGRAAANARRLLMCGEWIKNHSLHLFLLAAPDHLGVDSVLDAGAQGRELLALARRLGAAADGLIAVLAGRAVHPPGVVVGGLSHAPDPAALGAVAAGLDKAAEDARAALEFAAGLEVDEVRFSGEFLSLAHDAAYPMESGMVRTSGGLEFDPAGLFAGLRREERPHSSALHALVPEAGALMTGPLARFNNCFDRLDDATRRAAESVGIVPPLCNPLRTGAVRAVEMLYACNEARRLLEGEFAAAVAPDPAAGRGAACIEAPRGVLAHEYCLDAEGMIQECTIVTPTCLNLDAIERSLRRLAEEHAPQGEQALTRACAELVRSFDPCISCAVH